MSGYNISISYRESTWCLYYCVVMTQKLGTQMVPGKLVNRCLFPKIKYANNGFWPMPIWFHLLYWDITDITMNNRGYDHEHCYCYYRDCIWCLCMPLYASVFSTQQPSFIKWSFSVLKTPFLLWSWEFSCCWSSMSFHWNLYKGSRIIPTTGLMSIPQTKQFTWVHPSFDHVSMSK